MQKKIIALAVTGLMSGAAFAQSNVTVYGIMDIYYAHINPSGAASTNNIASGGLSGSRIGVRGTEDLGGGLKAHFNLESSVEAGQGAGKDSAASAFGGNTRQSNVGLSGGFGTVQVGTQPSLFDAWGSAYDYAGDLSAKKFLRDNTTSAGIAKVPNSVAYLSPSFSGLTAGFAHVMDETAGSNGDTNQFGLNYATGPMKATYVYSATGRGTGANRVTGNAMGVSYNFGAANVMFSHTDRKVGGTRGRFYQIGAVVPVTAAGNIHVGTGWTDGDARSSVVAYTHGLSKRTTAYAGYVINDLAVDNKILAAGLRHTF